MTILKLSEDIFISLSKILKVNYEVLQFNQEDDDSISDTVYGIKVSFSDAIIASLPDNSCFIPDISSDKDFVIDLAVKLATHHVLPIHTKDIIEDSLYYKYI